MLTELIDYLVAVKTSGEGFPSSYYFHIHFPSLVDVGFTANDKNLSTYKKEENHFMIYARV